MTVTVRIGGTAERVADAPNAADAIFDQGAVAQGELLHAVLERLTRHGKPEQVPDAAAIARWFGATGITDADAARAAEAVRRMLAAEALAHVFDAARFDVAHNEVELFSPDGALLRIDRLIERGDEVLVVDYKLRLLPVERAAYADQLRGYVAAVAPMYPGARCVPAWRPRRASGSIWMRCPSRPRHHTTLPRARCSDAGATGKQDRQKGEGDAGREREGGRA